MINAPHRYVTFHVQKSRLVTLGTCVHRFIDCTSLMRTNAKKIDIKDCKELVQSIPKCSWCFGNSMGQQNF